MRIFGHDGTERTMRQPVGAPWPEFVCSRRNEGEWQHHAHVGDGLYRHIGRCYDHDHGDHGHPGERDAEGCCCGRRGCDGTGPLPEDSL